MKEVIKPFGKLHYFVWSPGKKVSVRYEASSSQHFEKIREEKSSKMNIALQDYISEQVRDERTI